VIPLALPASRVELAPGDQAGCLCSRSRDGAVAPGTRHTVRGVARVRVESIDGGAFRVVILAPAAGESASALACRGRRSTRFTATSGAFEELVTFLWGRR